MNVSRVLLLALVAAGCRSQEGEGDALCPHLVWYKPSSPSARVSVVGDFNRWDPAATEMVHARADGYRVVEIGLPKGEARYAIVDDGAWLLDPNVATSAYYNGREVSWVEMNDCRAPSVEVGDVQIARGEATIPIDLRSGALLSDVRVEMTEGEGEIEITPSQVRVHRLPRGRSRARLFLGTTRARDVVLWNEETPFDFRDAVVYQVVTDRYQDANGVLSPPSSPGGRAGGTFNGVEKALSSLRDLGINVIWISPAYANPEGEFAGADGHMYTGYHGYWPSDPRRVEPKFGTDADLHSLIRTAHQMGMRVVFDVVPNHVHESHPYRAAHPDWFNGAPQECTCGTPGCDWATHMEECWFTPYLPDLDWRNGEVATQLTSDIVEWVDAFGADGVRIDAVPMMPRSANRRIAASLRRTFDHTAFKTWLIGENFTGPGGFDLLKAHLGPDGLDTEFHFPLMWTLRQTIASGEGSMGDIAATFETGEQTWAGAGATMGVMIGNHDVPRFASVSVGDAGGDAWSSAPLATDASVFERQRLALGVASTLPGAFFLYYGDEVALTGRGDPDTRRVLPSDSELSEAAIDVRHQLRAWLAVRNRCDLIRRGAYRTLYADREHLVFAREIEGRAALMVATRRADPSIATLAVPLAALRAGKYVEAVRGEALSLDPELTTLPSEAFSFRIYLPENDSCLPSPR